ncbi:Tail fiber protein [Ceratobasidium sp. AG-Ba]|nr:Tail fiber protein [Ceratobasidium sp. AG-Ba]
MPESPPRKVSGRERRPTQRLNEYDRAQGRLTTLSKSVGRKETPPTVEAQAAARAKKQAAIAAARGNTSRPGPLKSLSDSGNEHDGEDEQMDELENDDDDDEEAGPRLLDYRLEDLKSEVDRMEWLVQTIQKLGARHDYRSDPKFQDEHSLRQEWIRVLADGPPAYAGNKMSGDTRRIRTGQTHILKPQTSGHLSRVQLIRTDAETIGLDGAQVGSQDQREHGQPTPPKLSRTDKTTIGLDGKAVSPHASAVRRQGTSSNSSRPSQPTSTKRTHTDNPAPSKKRAVVPSSRIAALRKENARLGGGASNTPSSSRTNKPSKPVSNPRRPAPPDVEMLDPPSNDDRLPRPKTSLPDRPPTPPSEGPDEESSSHDEEPDSEEEDQTPVNRARPTRRQQAQLAWFPPEARPLVQWMSEVIRVDVVKRCGYPECITESADNEQPILEGWFREKWVEANNAFREGKPPLPFKNEYGIYVRNQLAPGRTSLKNTCDPLVRFHFDLRWSDPLRAKKANSLTDEGDERWLSPNLMNDDEIFKHPCIADAIEQEFFKSPKSLGSRHLEEFSPLVPIPTIAYTCAIIRNRIKAYAQDNGQTAELEASSDKGMFKMYLEMLENMRKHNPVHLLEIRAAITEQYLDAQPQPKAVPVPEMNLAPDAEIDMERLERIRNKLGQDALEIDDWDGVKDVWSKGKGKAPMRGGPSSSKH